MKLPDDAQNILRRRFQSGHRAWLAAGPSVAWPLELNLEVPTEQEAARQLQALRAWVEAWQKWEGPGQLVWGERRWRSLGCQQVPEKLILHAPKDVATWVGEAERFALAEQRHWELADRWPAITPQLSRHFDVLADYTPGDYQRLADALAWFAANPDSGLYLRQLPISGLDSKWIETKKSLFLTLVAALRGQSRGDGDFYAICGIRPDPQPVRLRILDANLRALVGGLGDLSASPEELAILDMPAARVFIVENLQTGLAFPELPGSVVFMGKGYAIERLAQLPWVVRSQTYYWGDMDTHGFAILNRIRGYLPGITSLLMDEETLLSHRGLWVEEKDQHRAEVLSGLTPAEHAVYNGLKQHRWGLRVRMEQERVEWEVAAKRLVEVTSTTVTHAG